MMSFEETMERLKDIMSIEVGEKSVRDVDLAMILGMSQTSFSRHRSKGKIPFKEIIELLATKKININSFFFNQRHGLVDLYDLQMDAGFSELEKRNYFDQKK